jgi:hypothetical protein
VANVKQSTTNRVVIGHQARNRRLEVRVRQRPTARAASHDSPLDIDDQAGPFASRGSAPAPPASAQRWPWGNLHEGRGHPLVQSPKGRSGT